MIGRHLRLLSLMALVATAAACDDDSTGLKGTPGNVEVRAYVDANGSGTFDAGDVPLSGAVVTLTSTSSAGVTFDATTDANGLASFDAVPPGSYSATLTGNAPAGAVLSSAASPVIVVPFQGGDFTSEFRFAFNPGTIAGVLFRDNNASGAFEPGTDTPAPGVSVALFPAGETSGEPLATTVTDNTGAFFFSTLRAGDYTLVFTPFPTITLVGGNEQNVTVAPAAETAVGVVFTGNLVMTIAEAKQEPIGGTVAVEGVVTSPQGAHRNDNMYIQDRSSGIQVFNVPTGAGYAVGDSVRVIGMMGVFNQERQIVRFSADDPIQITKLGTVTPIAPRVVTCDQLNALTFEGELLQLTNVRLESVPTGTGLSYNVVVQDEAGSNCEVRMDTNAGAAVPRSFWVVGRRYDITGVLGRFNAVAQLKIRGPADVETATAPLPIADARLRPAGDTLTIQGVVSVPYTAFGGAANGRTIYVQDATGGIMVFGVPEDVNAQPGDILRLTGISAPFGGEPQISRFSSTSLVVAVKVGTTAPPTPRLVTGAEALTRAYEGTLARMENVEVLAAPSGTTSYNVSIRAADGTAMQIRVSNVAGVGIPASFWEVGARYDVVGLLAFNNNNIQLKVRSPADVVKR